MPYPTKLKGGWQRPRQVVVNKSTAQLRESKATRKFLNKYHEVFQTSMVQGSNNPPGPLLYQEDGKTYASLPAEMLRNIQSSHLYQKMQKDCQTEGIEVPKTVMAKDPVAHMVTPQEYLQKVAAGQMPQMNNHEMFVELAAKNDQTKILLRYLIHNQKHFDYIHDCHSAKRASPAVRPDARGITDRVQPIIS